MQVPQALPPQDNDDDDDDDDDDSQVEVFCTCKRPSYGEMIACDNANCKVSVWCRCRSVMGRGRLCADCAWLWLWLVQVEWFHIGCVGLTSTRLSENEKWYARASFGCVPAPAMPYRGRVVA